MAPRDTDYTNNRLRTALFVSRLLQWASAVIVMGIASYYIAKYTSDRHEHIIYEEVIACVSVALFLVPLFLSYYRRNTWHTAPLDLIFSYLWLTAFVFTAQDYNYYPCETGPPSEDPKCSRKHALEAFTFLAFIFTFLSMILQHQVWVDERVVLAYDNGRLEKPDPTRPSGDNIRGPGVHIP